MAIERSTDFGIRPCLEREGPSCTKAVKKKKNTVENSSSRILNVQV